ncbi:hypothetical protein LMH87_010064 [Akanthomyces muscarius]|uniref:Uncharacterized protein n=1 Tax=Akanthomyces muscarius TaxID=2231603 RepID=A0A9W8UMU7_AKAMU|nr:hypothetical protein LMH87_010064 [Akanthomyces muscarius]KAJ4153581.1 hypothetical protein LMH87_010064 [Akanthomyces muscarius]
MPPNPHFCSPRSNIMNYDMQDPVCCSPRANISLRRVATVDPYELCLDCPRTVQIIAKATINLDISDKHQRLDFATKPGPPEID